MEFLGIKRCFLLIAVFGFILNTHAQETETTINAFKKSYEFEKEGEFKDAAEALKKVYREDSYELNLRIGWLTYQAGLFNESIGFYEKAIALMPYAIEPRFGVILPTSALGNWEHVENEYKKILEIDPNNTYANYRLGLIYYGRNDFLKANSFFEKVSNLYPFDYDSLLMLAWCKLKLQKTREAKILFNKVLLYNPGDASAKEGLGYLE